MPGRLRCDNLDFTDASLVTRTVDALAAIARDPANTHRLEVSKRYYFRTPDSRLSSGAGWYVIRDQGCSLYVGTAENLDNRLNSENGSRDQFANPQRASDPERNFIKAFSDTGVLEPLFVVVIEEHYLRAELGLTCELTKRDRHNVEKVLNLFREQVFRLAAR